MPNQSEKRFYNPNLVWINNIIFMCMLPSNDYYQRISLYHARNKKVALYYYFKSILTHFITYDYRSWGTMEPPLRHIHSRICPLECPDKLTNLSNRIQDRTYFTVFFFAYDSGTFLLQTRFSLLVPICTAREQKISEYLTKLLQLYVVTISETKNTKLKLYGRWNI